MSLFDETNASPNPPEKVEASSALSVPPKTGKIVDLKSILKRAKNV